MSSTVKNLTVTYNPTNESNTFTDGDWVFGQVSLEVVKECHIESLSIKFKGKAEVLWTERHGQTTVVYHSKNKYFSVKHYFVRVKKDPEDDNETLLTNQHGDTYSSVVAPGCHVYPFSFQFPSLRTPSSFSGSVGKIVYLLEAKLSRSMRIPMKDSTKLNFVSVVETASLPDIQRPQHESKDKKMKFFNSGTVAMDVDLEKSGFCQGEGLKVVAHIQNNSSREIKPKYCVYRKHSFFARGKRRLDTKDLLKEVGEAIPPSASEKVTRIITIPADLEPSILNCDIITAEYRLRVYLDVKYASDPEIKFPIIILPAPQAAAVAPPPAAADFGYGFPNLSYGNPEPFGSPPPYGAHAMYPPLTDFGNTHGN